MLRSVDYIKVYENGMVVTVFLDGPEIEYSAERKDNIKFTILIVRR